MTEFPRTLAQVVGPYPVAKIHGAAEGMGVYGGATRALVKQGLLLPDLITGMTLALLAKQPRKPQADGEKKASGVAGRVWVREHFTIHRPVAHGDAWVVDVRAPGPMPGRAGRTPRPHRYLGRVLATSSPPTSRPACSVTALIRISKIRCTGSRSQTHQHLNRTGTQRHRIRTPRRFVQRLLDKSWAANQFWCRWR